ncbi:MAG: hypothetical protein WBM45_09585 [Woeseiaceae bacterium]
MADDARRADAAMFVMATDQLKQPENLRVVDNPGGSCKIWQNTYMTNWRDCATLSQRILDKETDDGKRKTPVQTHPEADATAD